MFLEQIFTRVYSGASGGLDLISFGICLTTALVLGAGMAVLYAARERCSRGFAAALAVLPALVSVVILMVSGSLGASVAVAGTFSLVRFRSIPGTAREISAVFLAMAVGLACGMGYPGFAAVFAVVLCLFELLFGILTAGDTKREALRRELRITVPEELDFCGAFDEVLKAYTREANLEEIRTTDLGSLNRLTYRITLREAGREKELLDALRCRNGNLEIRLSLPRTETGVL